jgi:PAS domain S-box-containing protein
LTQDGYRKFYLNSDIKRARLGLAILLVPVIGFIVTDYALFGSTRMFYALSSLRIIMATITLFMLFYLTRIKSYEKYEKSITAWGFIAVVFSAIVSITRPANFAADQIITSIVYIFIIFLVIPNRLLYQTISSLIVTLGVAATVVVNESTVTLTALLSFCFAYAIAISVSWLLNVYRQQNYKEIVKLQETEKVLKDSKERFRALVETTSDWIWQVDQNGVYTYVSPKVKDILGYSPEEMLGKTPFYFIPKDESEKIAKIFSEIVAKKEPFHNLDNWNIQKDGTSVLMETSGVPILDTEGRLIGYRGIDRDVTEGKQAEELLRESKEQLAAVIANSPIGIATSDSEKHFLIANDAFCKILGYSEDELRKLTFKDITHPADIAESSSGIEDLSSGRIPFFSQEKRYVRKDGKIIYGKITVSVVRNKGKPVLFVAELEDISERKRMDEELQNYSKKLENLVEERTKQLKDSERLAAIGQTAGMVGHDIRNPLQAIVSELYITRSAIEETPDRPDKEEALESVNFIQEQVDYINKIVSDLQDYARAIVPEYSVADLSDVFVHVFETVSVPESISLSVNVKDAEKIRIDPTLLQRAITNLVNNAIQAMPEGGKLEVCGEKKDSTIIVSVSDTGVGIPDEVKPKLFTPMMTTKAKGQGFGLAVSKRIIEAMKGTISFESEEGKGTKFTIELPSQG